MRYRRNTAASYFHVINTRVQAEKRFIKRGQVESFYYFRQATLFEISKLLTPAGHTFLTVK